MGHLPRLRWHQGASSDTPDRVGQPAAERIHADDTTVPVLDVGKIRTGGGRSFEQIVKNALIALLFGNRRAFLLVVLRWPVREIKAMFPANQEVSRLRAVERAAHARLDRLNRMGLATEEVIKVAEEYWKEAAESLRDFQEE